MKKIFLIILLIISPQILTCSPDNKKNGEEMHSIKTIDLPAPQYNSTTSVEEALKNRRSIRSFHDAPLKLEHLAQILWAAYGITQKVDSGPNYLRGGLRTAPSAGALYPLEIYVVCGDVEKLTAGIYKYNSENHTLKYIAAKDDKMSQLSKAALGQSHVKNAAANLVYSAIFERTTRKYGQRGKNRYVCMDLGHSAENVYLQAYSLGIGTCAVGAFNDKSVREVMNLPEKETPLYIMPLGYIK
ncbi:MAG: SagB/ThcOx family dehydrogenase [Candidatus Marinimicrobia bacterium]|nr:SagB/ThcOx family dehydrogenase [Candidatus Neomarinimicrobiota bacterium]